MFGSLPESVFRERCGLFAQLFTVIFVEPGKGVDEDRKVGAPWGYSNLRRGTRLQ